METKNQTPVIITASEGYFLTQNQEVEILNRILALTVALGKHSKLEDWKEITKEEGEKILEKQKELKELEDQKQKESLISNATTI